MSHSVAAPSPADQGGGPPPLPHRRPRVREVSSRFMSPSPSISSAGDLHSITLKSPKHSVSTPALPDRSTKPSPSHRRLLLRPQTPQPEAFCSSSQDNIIIPPTAQSSETPFHYAKGESVSMTQRRQRKLFKENGFGENPKPSGLRTSTSKRQDTPSDRVVPSRFRLPIRQSSHTSSSVTDAAKLLQSINDSEGCQSESESVQGGSCPNSPISSHSRSSVADENTLSTRPLVRSSSGSSASCQSSTSSATPSLCTRSLNSFKSIDRGLCKPSPGISVSTEFRALPPQPTGAKLGGELRKVKKPQSAQQDVHSLKMLHNHYLLWRFANAKAEASMQAQRTEMEKQFFSVGSDISQLRDKVKKKQAELAILQREKALSTILESQMPYLDDWSALVDDYTSSLSGVTTALTNSLLRIPISGNVQVNVKEVAEALDSAVKTADMIANQMQLFMPKTEDMDSLMSELASVVDVEKALVEECGNLLVKTNTLQVEDCSLRGHLMQVGASPHLKQ